MIKNDKKTQKLLPTELISLRNEFVGLENEMKKYVKETELSNYVLHFKHVKETVNTTDTSIKRIILCDHEGEPLRDAAIMYVLSEENVLYGTTSEPFNHSFFLAGKPVKAAGFIFTNFDASIHTINNESGHYVPSTLQMIPALQFFYDELKQASNLTAIKYVSYDEGLKKRDGNPRYIKHYRLVEFIEAVHSKNDEKLDVLVIKKERIQDPLIVQQENVALEEKDEENVFAFGGKVESEEEEENEVLAGLKHLSLSSSINNNNNSNNTTFNYQFKSGFSITGHSIFMPVTTNVKKSNNSKLTPQNDGYEDEIGSIAVPAKSNNGYEDEISSGIASSQEPTVKTRYGMKPAGWRKLQVKLKRDISNKDHGESGYTSPKKKSPEKSPERWSPKKKSPLTSSSERSSPKKKSPVNASLENSPKSSSSSPKNWSFLNSSPEQSSYESSPEKGSPASLSPEKGPKQSSKTSFILD